MKKLFSIGILVGIVIATMVRPAVGLEQVKVEADRVNIRAKNSKTAETFDHQLSYGDILTLKSLQGEWVEVQPPKEVDFWVHSDFISGSAVNVSTLNMRAGPSINFSVVGSVERGQRIVERDRFGDWVKIAPPPSGSVWVHSSLVSKLEESPPEAKKPKMVVTRKKAVAPVKPRASVVQKRMQSPAPAKAEPLVTLTRAPTNEAPKGLTLVPLKGQGLNVNREGVLKRAGFMFGLPSPFRLVKVEQRRFETICYIYGNKQQLSELMDQSLRIEGPEYWVQGVRHPVLVPEKITPLSTKPGDEARMRNPLTRSRR